jgi:hypothetical protein
MLLNESRDVRDRLARMEAAKTDVVEATSLSTKANELKTWATKVQSLSGRDRLLRQKGVARSSSVDANPVLQAIKLSRERFAESPQSSTLVGGQRWAKLVTAVGEFSTAAETLQKQDWVNHFTSQLFAGVPPEQRKQTIVQSMPENIIAIKNYTQWYQRFIKYRNFVPASAEDFDEVQSCSDQLAAITFKENDDVPGPVKAFFNATSNASGASLDFLTAEVVQWLRTNHMLANYVVRAR